MKWTKGVDVYYLAAESVACAMLFYMLYLIE